MALITLCTDYGLKDHYVGALKARILKEAPGTHIVDITHAVPPSNLIHASFVIGSVYHEFPEGTVHLVAVNNHRTENTEMIAVKLKGHFFILPNNGLISLIEESSPDLVVELPEIKEIHSSFKEKGAMAKAAAQLAKGMDISNLGKPCKNLEKAMLLQPKAGKSGIFGHIIHIDQYGNLISNIREKAFEDILKLSGPKFEINFGKWNVSELNKDYSDVREGEMSVFFNSGGFLEIAVKDGNASQLFGLRYDSPVRITFNK